MSEIIIYEIGLVARLLFIDNKLNEYIYSKASKNDNSCVDLRELTSSSELRELVENKDAFDKLKELVSKADLTHKSLNPGDNGKIEEYIPAIFVANFENADFIELPIISPGIDVNPELPEVEKYDDYLVAWLLEENGNFQEILINEEMAMKTKHPVFIIDNAEEEITHRPKSVYEIPGKDMENSWYSGYDYQIFYRWDNSNYSEFSISAAQITENGSVWVCLKKDNGNWSTWKNIVDVHKNNIGSLLYHWEQVCSNNVTPFNSNFIFWNTFEYDWDRSDKSLGDGTRNGSTVKLSGKRKYTGDYYGYSPSQVNNNPLDLNYIYLNWAKWHYGNGGNYSLWRIQP